MGNDQPELDGMPEPVPILRLNGDDVYNHDEDQPLNVDDEVQLRVRGIVKRTGDEHAGKTPKRRFIQVHVSDVTVTKVTPYPG